MPLQDYQCTECGEVKEYLVRSDADIPTQCTNCGAEQMERKITAFGGYSGAFGGGSTTPKNAGSFRGKK